VGHLPIMRGSGRKTDLQMMVCIKTYNRSAVYGRHVTAVNQSDTLPPAIVAPGAEVSVNGYLFLHRGGVRARYQITTPYAAVHVLEHHHGCSGRPSVFVGAAEQLFFEERQIIITRLACLKGSMMALSLRSGELFPPIVGVWIYQRYASF
jgi:hypothetical protein